MAKPPRPHKALKPKKAKGESGGRSLTWLSGLACGMLAAIAPGIATVLACLLAPAILALWLDREPGRPMARTVLTFGLAGCVRPVIVLWNAGQSFDTALALATDPATFGPAWATAAAGWLIIQLAPLGVRAALDASALTHAARIRTARAQVIEAWGLDQAGNDGDMKTE